MATLKIPTDTSQATLGYLLADGTIVGSTSQAQDFGSNGIKADVIAESTGAAGVTIDSVLLKDGEVGNLADNKAVILGDSSDDKVYHDGTNLVLEPRVNVHIKAAHLLLDDNKFIQLGTTAGAALAFDGDDLTLTLSDQATSKLIIKATDDNSGNNYVLFRDITNTSPVYPAFNKLHHFTVGATNNIASAPYFEFVPSTSLLLRGTTGFKVVISEGLTGGAKNGLLMLGDGAGGLGRIQDAGGAARVDITDGGTTILRDDVGVARLTIDSSDPFVAITGAANLSSTLDVAALSTLSVAGVALDVQNTTDGDNQVGILRGGNRGSPGDDDYAYLSLMLDRLDGTQTEFHQMRWVATDVSSGDEDGQVEFWSLRNNSLRRHTAFGTAGNNGSKCLVGDSSNKAMALLAGAAGSAFDFDQAGGFVIEGMVNSAVGTGSGTIVMTAWGNTGAAAGDWGVNIGPTFANPNARFRVEGSDKKSEFEGWVQIAGALSTDLTAISEETTLDDTHHVVVCDASGGAFPVHLPAASGVPGRIYHIKKIDSSGNAVTVDGNSSETIDGDTTKVINVQYDSMMISCDGSNWHII